MKGGVMSKGGTEEDGKMKRGGRIGIKGGR